MQSNFSYIATRKSTKKDFTKYTSNLTWLLKHMKNFSRLE